MSAYFAQSSWQFGTTALTGPKDPAALLTIVFEASGKMSRQDKDKYLNITMKIVLTSTDSLKGLVYSKNVFAIWSCLCNV